MIHNLKLPKLTRQRLMDIVLLQVDLLYFAASTSLNSESRDTWKSECAKYLDNNPLDQRFKGRGQAVAGWLWDAGTSTRHQYLEKFASLAPEERVQKQAWCKRLRTEIRKFAELHDKHFQLSDIAIGNFFDNENHPSCKKIENITTWRCAASCFFLYFYETYLGTDVPFPLKLFSGTTREAFGRQELLNAFLKENKGLEICPICDMALYYARDMGKAKDEPVKIHATLDHYLPKSHYPHFSCHPYNLIPVCHSCNSTFKGERDPLLDSNSQRMPLHRAILPYGTFNVSASTYLKAEIGNLSKTINIGELRPRVPDAELEKTLAILKEVYDIPHRWQDASDQISESLFRRMRQFLGNSGTVKPIRPIGPEEYGAIQSALEQLLFYLSDEDENLRKDPFAFAMMWVLVALINEYVVGPGKWNYALLEEISSWFGQDLAKNIERLEKVRKLLAVPAHSGTSP